MFWFDSGVRAAKAERGKLNGEPNMNLNTNREARTWKC